TARRRRSRAGRWSPSTCSWRWSPSTNEPRPGGGRAPLPSPRRGTRAGTPGGGACTSRTCSLIGGGQQRQHLVPVLLDEPWANSPHGCQLPSRRGAAAGDRAQGRVRAGPVGGHAVGAGPIGPPCAQRLEDGLLADAEGCVRVGGRQGLAPAASLRRGLGER